MVNYDPSQCQDEFLKPAFSKLKLDTEVQEILQTPQREIKVEIPIRLSNGDIKRFEGFRVQHNDFCGPFKGGMRYHPSVDMKHIMGKLCDTLHTEMLPRHFDLLILSKTPAFHFQ